MTSCARCLDERVEHPLEWAERARGESELRRLDRHFNELLQELRVVQTGAQILFAFLLGLAFTPRFAAMDSEQRVIHLAALVLAAGSLAMLIAPVAYHRMVFRRRLRDELVTCAHLYLRIGLALLFAALLGAVHLAASFVLGGWSALLAVALAALFAVPWYLLPLRHRQAHQHHHHGGVARSPALDSAWTTPTHRPLVEVHHDPA